jgi:sugar (pentulose or hexulose) kinase
MNEQYIIGIDSGTQSTRAIIYDTKGNRIARGAALHPKLISSHQGWAEHGINDLWDALRAAVADMFSHFTGRKEAIAAIGLSTQGACFFALDKADNLLYNPISWLDERWRMNIPAMGQLAAKSTDPLYNLFWPYYSKANWFKFNEPAVYERAAKYGGVSSYLGLKLTGAFYESIANSMGLPYDIINWKAFDTDTEIQAMGMRRDQIAPPVPAGTVIGTVSPEAAAATGLPEGCPVALAARDKQCELLGAGAVQHGQAYLTLGTLSGLDIVCSEYKPAPDLSYLTYLSAFPKLYTYESMANRGFLLVSWFRDTLGEGLKSAAQEAGISVEALLDSEAELIPAGSEGLVVLPDWSPSTLHPSGKGIYLGFDDRHQRGHMFRSLVEGIIIQIKLGTVKMSEYLDIAIKELYIGGGGSKSNFTAQIIADVFNVPVNRTQEAENCSLGAAICGAVGAGFYADLQSAVAGMGRGYDQFFPNKENHELYEALSARVIEKLYPTLESILKDLSALTAAQHEYLPNASHKQ